MQYGLSKITNYTFEQAIEKVTDELKKEGFGILSTIDFKDTFKKKIDVDYKNYTVLGACFPRLAHSALQVENEVGLLLPCNVAIYENEGSTLVSIFNPMILTVLVDKPDIKPIAEEVKSKLEKVLNAI